MLAFGVKETSTTTGTGNLTLAGVTGFPRCNDAFPYTAGRRFEYAILDDTTGAPIENGIGYLTTDANTLVREKVLATFASSTYTSIAASAVALPAGTKRVIITKGMATAHIGSYNIDSGSTTSTPRRVAFDSSISLSTASSTSVSIVANKLYLVPFRLGSALECSGMQIRVGSGVAASNVRLGLYAVGSNGYPSVVLGETAALASATSSVDVSGSFASNIRLLPGDYCCTLISDGAIVVGGVAAASGNFFGGDPSNLVATIGCRHYNMTMGALPNPAPTASAFYISSALNRIIFGLTAV